MERYMLKLWWGLCEKDLTQQALKGIHNSVSNGEFLEAVEHKRDTNSVAC